MRWLFHIVERGAPPTPPGAEGFVHCSYRDAVAETARIHFPRDAKLQVLQVDPRRVGARIEDAPTPRGPMPHVFGPIPSDAIRATLDLGDVAAAPDAVTGTRFVFVAFSGMTLLDLVGMHDPIARLASMRIDPASTSTIVSLDGTTVFEEAGARLVVDRVRGPLDEFDVLLVAGGLATRKLQDDPDVARWLATFPENRIAVSVCSGALLLGAAGRLRGRRATTHASALPLLARHGATAVTERVVDEGTVITGAGVTSALDIGLHVVRRLYGEEAARRIADQMEMR
jgi:cyclohexyl-isocyanide hydratase